MLILPCPFQQGFVGAMLSELYKLISMLGNQETLITAFPAPFGAHACLCVEKACPGYAKLAGMASSEGDPGPQAALHAWEEL